MTTIKVGDQVLHFQLRNQNGEVIDISKFIGRPMVIFFYPKDDTPGCTREACGFRDEFHIFNKAGVAVFGISVDSVESHAAFGKKYNLPFDLLSDPENKIRKQFGVPTDLFGMIPGRVTYVVDKRGKVIKVFNSQTNYNKHISESLSALGLS